MRWCLKRRTSSGPEHVTAALRWRESNRTGRWKTSMDVGKRFVVGGDDNPSVCRAIQLLLRSAGIATDVFCSGGFPYQG
jgi:hypothetical protein